MYNLEDIYKLLQDIRDQLTAAAQQKISPAQIQIVEGLSDVSKKLGLLQAGEFRSGNGVEPGSGFTGVRIGYPPFWYANNWWNVVGIENDSLQFGLDAIRGSATFAAGQATMDADGMTVTGLTYPIRLIGTNGSSTRTGKLGMVVPSGSSVPSMQLTFEGPVGAELLTNGGSESADLTGWTDSAGAWSVDTNNPYAGTYFFKHDEANINCPANLVQNVSGLTAGYAYRLEFASKAPQGMFTPNIILVWKTGGGAEVSRDTMFGVRGNSWSLKSQIYKCPNTATNVDVMLSPGDSFGDACFDDVSFTFASVNMSLSFVPDLRIGGGSFIVGETSLATSATDGFLYIPSMSGTPINVPTTYTGTVAMVYDTLNNKLYVYNGAWKGVTLS